MLESERRRNNLLQVENTDVPQRVVQRGRTLPLVERGKLFTGESVRNGKNTDMNEQKCSMFVRSKVESLEREKEYFNKGKGMFIKYCTCDAHKSPP